MADEKPGQSAEGRLIEEAAKADGRSIRALSANAGISDTRWRQVIRGWQLNGAGQAIEARAGGDILARMALVVGVTPDQLREVGRPDAAVFAERLAKANPGDTVTLIDGGHPRGDSMFVNADGTYAVIQAKTYRSSDQHPDEIDLIYASNMSAREKLLRIRQVLQLRAQAEAEEARQREKAPATESAAESNETELRS